MVLYLMIGLGNQNDRSQKLPAVILKAKPDLVAFYIQKYSFSLFSILFFKSKLNERKTLETAFTRTSLEDCPCVSSRLIVGFFTTKPLFTSPQRVSF